MNLLRSGKGGRAIINRRPQRRGANGLPMGRRLSQEVARH